MLEQTTLHLAIQATLWHMLVDELLQLSIYRWCTVVSGHWNMVNPKLKMRHFQSRVIIFLLHSKIAQSNRFKRQAYHRISMSTHYRASFVKCVGLAGFRSKIGPDRTQILPSFWSLIKAKRLTPKLRWVLQGQAEANGLKAQRFGLKTSNKG